MKWYWILSLIVVSAFTSCGSSSNRNAKVSPLSYNTTVEDNDEGYSDPQQQMVQCPMCGGTGIIDYMPGDIYSPKAECPACYGQGMCDINRAQEAVQAIAQANAMMNGAGYCDEPGLGYDGGYNSGRSAYEIEYDLRKAYDQLQSMEEDYRNCSSSVTASQYPSMIASQKELIRQLEAELRNAQ